MDDATVEASPPNNESPQGLPAGGLGEVEEVGIKRVKPSPNASSDDGANNATGKRQAREKGASKEMKGGKEAQNDDDSGDDSAKRAIPADQAVDAVRASIGKRLRVTLTDERTIEGTLECFDDSGNMILSGASNISSRRVFRLGNVLVPGPVATRIVRARPNPRGYTRGLTRGLDQLSIRDGDESGTGQ